jgi:hypothetical protein
MSKKIYGVLKYAKNEEFSTNTGNLLIFNIKRRSIAPLTE